MTLRRAVTAPLKHHSHSCCSSDVGIMCVCVSEERYNKNKLELKRLKEKKHKSLFWRGDSGLEATVDFLAENMLSTAF